MGIRRRIREQDFAHALELCRGIGDGLAALSRHEHMHVGAELLGSRERLRGGIAQRSVIVLGEKKRRHHKTPASFFSLATSSATLATFTPPLRLSGSTVFSTC